MPRNQLGGLFVLELLTTPPSPRTLPADEAGEGGGLGMVDPEQVAARVLAMRESICVEWGTALRDDTPAKLQKLLADSLEAQLLQEEQEE